MIFLFLVLILFLLSNPSPAFAQDNLCTTYYYGQMSGCSASPIETSGPSCSYYQSTSCVWSGNEYIERVCDYCQYGCDSHNDRCYASDADRPPCPITDSGTCLVSTLCKIGGPCYNSSWRSDTTSFCSDVNRTNEGSSPGFCDINLYDLTSCGANLEPYCRNDSQCGGGTCNIQCTDANGQPIGTCSTPPPSSPSTPTPTLTLTPTSTLTPTPPAPPTPTPSSQWFKVLEGDVHANSTSLGTSIVVAVPTNRYFADRETAPSTQGSVVSSAGTFSNPLQARLHSDPNKQFKVQRQPVSSKLTDQDYTYFKNKYAGKDTTPNAYEIRCSGLAIPHDLSGKTIWYFSDPTVTYKLCGGGNYSGRATVIIEGSLEIQDNLDLAANSALAFFVRGDITVRNNVQRISGFYLTDGQFETGSTTNQELTVYGSVVANSFSLRRQKINSSEPAETFIYQPSLLLNLVDILGERKYNWREARK